MLRDVKATNTEWSWHDINVLSRPPRFSRPCINDDHAPHHSLSPPNLAPPSGKHNHRHSPLLPLSCAQAQGMTSLALTSQSTRLSVSQPLGAWFESSHLFNYPHTPYKSIAVGEVFPGDPPHLLIFKMIKWGEDMRNHEIFCSESQRLIKGENRWKSVHYTANLRVSRLS